MLPFTSMLVRLSLAPLEIARAYSEAFSSAESLGVPRLTRPQVDPYKGTASAAPRFTSLGNRPVGQSTNLAKVMQTQFYDNQLATVDYQILFTKRGNELILESATTIVAKAMTGSGFASWKIAQFIRRNPDLNKPAEWGDKEWDDITEKNKLKDKYFEFLQVEYQVLSTLDRKAPTDQVAALLEIASAIKQKQ